LSQVSLNLINGSKLNLLEEYENTFNALRKTQQEVLSYSDKTLKQGCVVKLGAGNQKQREHFTESTQV